MKKGVLALKGPLSIKHANKLKEKLGDFIERFDEVELKVDQLGDVDISTLQLLCSAHGAACAQNKRLTTAGPLSDGLIDAVRRASFQNHAGCPEENDKTCLWAGIEAEADQSQSDTTRSREAPDVEPDE